MSAALKGSRKANSKPKSTTARAERTKASKWDAEALRKTLCIEQPTEGEPTAEIEPQQLARRAEETLYDASNALAAYLFNKKGPEREVRSIGEVARVALSGLRKWRQTELTKEQRASSIVSKLLALDCPEMARGILDDTRPSLLELYSHAPASDNVLTLPLPISTLDDSLLALLTTTLVHRLYVHIDHPDYLPSLTAEGAFWSWAPHASESVLKRAFTALSKSSSFPARVLALKCILKTNEIDPDAFWGQTCYFASTYAKSIDGDSVKQRAVCSEVCRAYDELAKLASSREAFLEGENFVKFCKHWMSFARRLRAPDIIQNVSQYLQASPAHDHALETAQMCARFVRISRGLLEPNPELVEEINACTSLFLQPRHKKTFADTHVASEMDRLRRTCTEYFNETEVINPELRASLVQLLLALINPNRLHNSIDSLIVLARKNIILTDNRTWDNAFGYLDQATSLLYPPTEKQKDESTYSAAQRNYMLRYVANASYNVGGLLYSTEHYGGAARFFMQTGKLYEDGLERYPQLCGDPDAGKPEDWEACRKRLPKLWEALGRCNIKMGDRRQAFDAYVKSLRQALSLESGLPLSNDVALLIERITNIGVAELYLPAEQISLQRVLGGDRNVDAERLGAMLEAQLDYLRHQYRKKDGKAIAKAMMLECVKIYDKDMPIRKARSQLRMIEFGVQQGDDSIEINSLVQEIQKLSTIKVLHKDKELQLLQHLYPACAEAWLIFSLRRKRSTATSPEKNALQEHVNRLVLLLQNHHMSRAPVPTTAKKSVSKAPVKQTKPSSRPASRPASRSTTPANKTPRRPKALLDATDAEETDKSKNSSSAGKKSAASDLLDNECRIAFELLETCAHFMGVVGHWMQRLQVLDMLRVATEDSKVNARVTLSVALELHKLGLNAVASSLVSTLENSIKASAHPVSEELAVLIYLRHAQISSNSDLPTSIKLYAAAFDLAQKLSSAAEHPGGSQRNAGLERIKQIERVAVAATVFAELASAQDHPNLAIKAHQQALRLWGRAAELLFKCSPPSSPAVRHTPRPASPNPFAVTDLKEAISELADSKASSGSETAVQHNLPAAWLSFHRSAASSGSEWKIAEGITNSMLSVIKHMINRGSVKAARRFLDDIEAFAESLESPALRARVFSEKAEMHIRVGESESAHKYIEKATCILSEISGPEKAYTHRVHGMYHAQKQSDADADEMFDKGMTFLQNLESNFLESCPNLEKLISSAPDGSNQLEKEVFLAEMVAAILHETVWLWRDNQDEEDFEGGISLLIASSQTDSLRGVLSVLLGKLKLRSIYSSLRNTLALSSLTESTLSIPLGVAIGDTNNLQSNHDVGQLLSQAEENFKDAIRLIHKRGDAPRNRESLISLALLRVFQTSLGLSYGQDPIVVANLLDLSSSWTLRREMLEAIDLKLASRRSAGDVVWPKPDTLLTGDTKLAQIEDGKGSDDEGKSDTYWRTLHNRYSGETPSMESLSTSVIDDLPEKWTVINISITEDQSSLLVSRQRPRKQPLAFCIPLDRHGRKEDGNEDQQLSFDDAIKELDIIVSASNRQARAGVNVEGSEAKTAWWTERKALNARMKELLENIEFCWLGAFKSIFCEPYECDSNLIAEFRERLGRVFHRFIHNGSKQKEMPTLDGVLLECFSTLSPKCRDEELEDFIYFLLDLYQFHGIPVALAELDTDEIVVELRTALEDFASKFGERIRPIDDAHLFLVLDKNVQAIPWESIPTLRGKSISRIPCLSFLLDRVALPIFDQATGGVTVDPTRGFYVLNPSCDLKHTEATFRPWTSDMDAVGWGGIIGRSPMELEMVNALEQYDIFMYFGHGGGEQYIRSRRIRQLKSCAATFLWGCSSGLMKDLGSFDREGVPGHYMIAGCPMLVANLWDVTDRDMDKFTWSTFNKLGLNKSQIRKRQEADGNLSDNKMSVVSAIAQSRTECKMDYLVGAAPVVYGVPFYL